MGFLTWVAVLAGAGVGISMLARKTSAAAALAERFWANREDGFDKVTALLRAVGGDSNFRTDLQFDALASTLCASQGEEEDVLDGAILSVSTWVGSPVFAAMTGIVTRFQMRGEGFKIEVTGIGYAPYIMSYTTLVNPPVGLGSVVQAGDTLGQASQARFQFKVKMARYGSSHAGQVYDPQGWLDTMGISAAGDL